MIILSKEVEDILRIRRGRLGSILGVVVTVCGIRPQRQNRPRLATRLVCFTKTQSGLHQSRL